MYGIFLFVLLTLVSVSCSAETIRYVCPPYITVSESIKSRPSEWRDFNPDLDSSAKHYLEYVSFTDGHPRDLAYLRPSLENKLASGKDVLITSVFEVSGVSPDGMYLVCGYVQTSVILFKSIGSSHKVCNVTHSDITHTVKSVICD